MLVPPARASCHCRAQRDSVVWQLGLRAKEEPCGPALGCVPRQPRVPLLSTAGQRDVGRVPGSSAPGSQGLGGLLGMQFIIY